jgi:hypothetical protein
MPPPRIFCIPALEAPVAAVIRRGPSSWSHVGRWDIADGTYQAGSWLRGTLYPQRCDISPDGRWLAYFALKPGATWDVGATYIAISRLPWLSALAAWQTCGTWTLGLRFDLDRSAWGVNDPSVGDLQPIRRRFGLVPNADVTFAVERRRGWSESADTPSKEAEDPWEIRRAPRITMEKPRPGDARTVLRVSGTYAALRRSMPGQERIADYVLVDDGRPLLLADIQWADWDADGRLLVATTDGCIQIRDLRTGDASGDVVSEVDLAAFKPEPTPPPPSAYAW